ncbi:hypothetical protein A5641_01320 [Mycobacterium sp. 1554424.7]|nr:hypothetical protein A5641_01320 [Mycobacterium sp. 1554424.7]
MTRMNRMVRAGSATTLTGLLVTAGFAASAPLVYADPEPVMHHVKYAVTAENPIYTDIYYLDHQPARFSDYSHDPYSFTPHVDVDIAPGKPWTFDLDMTDPDHYAMVVASTGTEPGTPGIHCVLAVDGAVVVSNGGPKGALCSLRNW